MYGCFHGKVDGQRAKQSCNSRLITALGKRYGIASVPFQQMRSFGGRELIRHIRIIRMTMLQ